MKHYTNVGTQPIRIHKQTVAPGASCTVTALPEAQEVFLVRLGTLAVADVLDVAPPIPTPIEVDEPTEED